MKHYILSCFLTGMSRIYDPGQKTLAPRSIWKAVAEPMTEFQGEIHVIANILAAIIAILLAIHFIGDAIYLASSTSMLGSIHDKSWAYKGMLKTIVCIMLDGGAWILTNFIVMLATGA